MAPKKFVAVGKLISLTQKRAIVTGGARGIGFAISYRLAEAGATVFMVDQNLAEVQKASQELSNYGYQAKFRQCDVSQEDGVKDMVNAGVGEMGGIDILVNNAGIYPRIPLAQMTGEDFERTIAVNLKGTFLCAQPKAKVRDEVRKKLALLCPGLRTAPNACKVNCHRVCPKDAISHSW